MTNKPFGGKYTPEAYAHQDHVGGHTLSRPLPPKPARTRTDPL